VRTYVNSADQGQHRFSDNGDKFRDALNDVARHFFGTPNRSLSRGSEMRYGSRGSLSVDIKKGVWRDHETGEGGGTLDLVMREMRFTTRAEAAQWCEDKGFIRSDEPRPKPNGKGPAGTPTKKYHYTNLKGESPFYVQRYENPKDFRPFLSNGKMGLPDGEQLVVYRLPEITEAIAQEREVDIFEGEKDADAAAEIGLNATCCQGGSSGWRSIYNETFRGANVRIVPHNDDAGRKFAATVSANLSGIAARIRILKLWESWKECPEKGDFYDWREAGHTREQYDALADALVDAGPSSDVWTDAAPAFSEEAIAIDFANRHAGDLRYVAKWNQWFCWDGTCWREDQTRKVFSIARGLCRELALTVNKSSESKRVASAKTRAAVVSLAGEDHRLAATTEQWDANPWLLNTPGGVIDLRTGVTRAHCADDYMTKRTAVAPAGDCPRWKAFMDKITGGDEALQRFLQRWCGYALTGSTREHAMGFGFGVGANGKSVFTNTITGVLADYATTAPIETFTVTSTEQHPTELARLRGARLVVATETEEGRRWAESKIKMLTGGDRTAARFMRQDFFEFTPQFKLWIVGNHKPGLRSVNEAIRRRFLLVPFDVVIPPADRDADLAGKLKDEWPGILQWMVEGTITWQRDGLAAPAAVANATEAYLEGEDAIALWLEECTVPDTNAWANSSDLFKSWKEWSEAAGEYTGNQRRFSQNLETKGLIPERRKLGRGYRGRQLRESWELARTRGLV
jgi:putative DNA primase/helicase